MSNKFKIMKFYEMLYELKIDLTWDWLNLRLNYELTPDWKYELDWIMNEIIYIKNQFLKNLCKNKAINYKMPFIMPLWWRTWGDIEIKDERHLSLFGCRDVLLSPPPENIGLCMSIDWIWHKPDIKPPPLPFNNSKTILLFQNLLLYECNPCPNILFRYFIDFLTSTT